MIAVDASLVIDVLIGREEGETALGRLIQAGGPLVAPEILDLELLQVLRRMVNSGRLDLRDAEAGLKTLSDLNIQRFPHRILTDRIWALRHNLTAYDAAYFALAEVLGVPLWTRDAKFAGIPGANVVVEVL